MKTLTLPRDFSSLETCQNSTNCLVASQNSSSAITLNYKRGSQIGSMPITQLSLNEYGGQYHLSTKQYTQWNSNCGNKLNDFLNYKPTLLILKISQLCLTVINVWRNLLVLFYISKKMENSKTATEMMSIKEKHFDSCLATNRHYYFCRIQHIL